MPATPIRCKGVQWRSIDLRCYHFGVWFVLQQTNRCGTTAFTLQFGQVYCPSICNVSHTFHTSPSAVLAVAQFFGMMPISGVRSTNVQKLRFQWRSVRVIWSLFYLSCGIVLSGLYALRLHQTGLNTKNLREILIDFGLFTSNIQLV